MSHHECLFMPSYEWRKGFSSSRQLIEKMAHKACSCSQPMLFPKDPFPCTSTRWSLYFSTSKGIHGNISNVHTSFQILQDDTSAHMCTEIWVRIFCLQSYIGLPHWPCCMFVSNRDYTGKLRVHIFTIISNFNLTYLNQVEMQGIP